jgi:prepilin signal peptidase PulO-like enzyme (type II secretory pathway)
MTTMQVIQIMAVLYFLFALRFTIWRTSLNSFIVIAGFFIITVSYEFELFKRFWLDYHLVIVAIIMTMVMVRVVYQSIRRERMKRVGGRRANDKC